MIRPIEMAWFVQYQSELIMIENGDAMQNLTCSRVPRKLGKTMSALCQLAGTLVLGLCIGTGVTISNAGAEEQSAHSMHDMSDMKDMDMSDMKEMQGMEHMDHSKHMQSMSKRGAYNSSVMSYSVPDVKLVDENGKPVSLRELTDGRSPVMLNFIFTTCTTICPVMTSTFQQVQEKLGKNRNEVRMVSVSIDPENDTPAKLKEYAAKYKADTQWTFLTGSLENDLIAQKAFGVFAGEKMNHKPITFLKAKGSDTRWIRLEGLAEADQVINEYDKLSMEKMKHE
jgi:protein SCO1/2